MKTLKLTLIGLLIAFNLGKTVGAKGNLWSQKKLPGQSLMTQFPDTAFRTYLSKTFNLQFDAEGVLLTKNDYFIVDTITSIDVHNLKIETLKGIELMKHLKSLNCGFNNISSLDLSANSMIENLVISGNAIAQIDLSNNLQLKNLFCNNTALDSIDLGGHTHLQYFWASDSKLQKIRFSQNDSLNIAFIANNKLKSLDFSECPHIKGLACDNNQLTSLDLSKVKELQFAGFGSNPISSIDLSELKGLINLVCTNTKLTTLNLSNNQLLTMIECSKTPLKQIDISKCSELVYFDCSNNKQLTSLDLRFNKHLNTLKLNNNSNMKLCYVANLPYPAVNQFVVTDSCPVSFTPAGNKLIKFLDKLYDTSVADKTKLADSLMATIDHFPLIEDTIATFIYRGPGAAVKISGDAYHWNDTGISINNIPQTNIWYYTQIYERDARLDYKFIVDGSWITDPLNPLTCASGFGNNSELRMPDYVQTPETAYYPEIPHGQIISKSFSSGALGNSRTIKLYLPPNYNEAVKDSFPLAIFHDGLEYISLANANNTLDYLIANKKIRPIIGLFIPPVDRPNEYRGTLSDKFVQFIGDEILAMIPMQYRILRDPKYRASIGISNGGDISQHLGFKLSNKIGNIGSFSAGGYWYTNEYMFAEKLNLNFYIDAGTYDEWGFLDNNQLFVDRVLKAKGYNYQFKIFHEGHSWGNWKAHLHYALEQFFPYTDLQPVNEHFTDKMKLSNYPNPFRGQTKVTYSLSNYSSVKLIISSLTGEVIKEITDGDQSSGTHALNVNMEEYKPGMYMLTLYANDKKISTTKLIKTN